MRLGLLNCGGTITERYAPDGALTRMSAVEVAALAGLGSTVEWTVHDVEVVDSNHLTFASLCRARAAMRSDLKSERFVLCCGTDAMEDVAYATTLLFDRDRPVALTGAALPGGNAGSDAPLNLRDAALLVCSMPTGMAPLMAFGGRAFDPFALCKVWPQSVQAFGPDTAVRGTIEADIVLLSGQPQCPDSFAELGPDDLDARVAIVTDTFGPLVGFPTLDDLDGIVLAGKGAGGFSTDAEEQLRRAARQMPVVLSTRSPQGFRVNPAIGKHAYRRAHDIGLITAGYEGLNASKARIRLIAEIGSKQAVARRQPHASP